MRLFSTLLLAASAASLAACADDETAGTVEQPSAPAAQTAPAQTAATDGALGYTRAQLLDADLRDASGAELGEVEAVITDETGAIVALAVEVEGPDPDPVVRVPLAGLTTVTAVDDRDLQTTMTTEQLRALPAWQPN